MKKFLHTVLVFMIIGGGVVTALTFMQPLFYRSFPSDKDRHHLIIDELTRKSDTDNWLVFGDSRTMFGVDTRIIKEELNTNVDILNLSSVGQDIFESSYFYGLVKGNTKVVIQCTSPAFFSRNLRNHHISEDVALSMCLSGYMINESTKTLIKDYNKVFDRNRFVNYFAARSIIKTYIHSNIMRPLLDNETFDKTARHSLYFPHSYTADRHPNYPVYDYDCTNFRSTENPAFQLSFLISVMKYFKDKGINYLIVLMPVNPDECRDCYEDFEKYEEIVEAVTNIEVINLSDFLVDTDYFYDATHANKKGAKIISSEIAKQIKNLTVDRIRPGNLTGL